MLGLAVLQPPLVILRQAMQIDMIIFTARRPRNVVFEDKQNIPAGRQPVSALPWDNPLAVVNNRFLPTARGLAPV